MNSPPSVVNDRGLPRWSEMLAEHRGWLRAVIFARLRDHHAVEEVLQETALAAARSSHPVDGEGIGKWLYRVAVRQSLVYRRREARNGRRLDEKRRQVESRLCADEDRLDPFALVVASEQQHLVREALAQLCPRDAQILILKYTEGWSCREIATCLEVSSSAIKSRLLRARRNLRTELMRNTNSWKDQ